MPECITRTKRGHFRAPNGRRLSPEDIQRAKSLGIPPAYTDVCARLYQKFQEKIKPKRPTLSTKALEKAALEATAKQLGHTPSVCKKYYLL